MPDFDYPDARAVEAAISRMVGSRRVRQAVSIATSTAWLDKVVVIGLLG